MSAHDEFPYHCLLQTWWYPRRSNLVLVWDCEELLSMGLPDSSQSITIVIVGVMMAIRWLEAHVKENKRQGTPTREELQELDCLKDLDLFETMCKILNIPMEVKKIWARGRLSHGLEPTQLHGCTSMPKSICRSTAECTVRINWTLEQELLSQLL